jgi:PAS domain-containing protein
MQPWTVLYLAALSILTVFLVLVGWEFVIEDVIGWHLAAGGGDESTHERWEGIVTATIACVVFWTFAGPVLFRIIAERNRAERRLREAIDTLDQNVKIRTVELENEITRRTRSEHALRRLASIVETSADAITAMTLDGIITS